ncbi:helix-turn-helix transcriptional regulator [Brevundimonas sp.]|uniref:helix-turn-helix transcriptional regulator n=1 Tax=Brevundimonas sp. TaxID=1871086 RepID=UPI002FCAC884
MTANPPDAFDPSGANDRLLPWRKVKELTGISRTTAWRMQNAGEFPRPVVISPGRVGWREREVAAWKAALAPRGARNLPTQPRLFEPEPDLTPPPEPVRPSPEQPTALASARAAKRSPRRRRVAANQLSFNF